MIELRSHQAGGVDAVVDCWFRRRAAENPVVVMPTGSGKAYTIAAICKEIYDREPFARIAVVIHSKELVEQNYDSIKEYWPKAPAGVYSASVGRKDRDARILVAGIQTLAGNLSKTGGLEVIN